MRLKVRVEVPRLPILYRHRFMSFIKRLVEMADAEYFRKFFSSSRRPAPYSFAVILPPDRVARKETFQISPGSRLFVRDTVFYLRGPVHWIITSPFADFMGLLVKGFLQYNTHPFNDRIQMKVIGVDISEAPRVDSSELILKSLSPVLVENRKHIPLLPGQEGFEEELNAIMDGVLRGLRGEGLKMPLSLIPMEVRKSVVKHKLEGFYRGSGKPYMYLTGFSGTFRLRGFPDDLKFIMEAGLGLRRGQGFGTLGLA